MRVTKGLDELTVPIELRIDCIPASKVVKAATEQRPIQGVTAPNLLSQQRVE